MTSGLLNTCIYTTEPNWYKRKNKWISHNAKKWEINNTRIKTVLDQFGGTVVCLVLMNVVYFTVLLAVKADWPLRQALKVQMALMQLHRRMLLSNLESLYMCVWYILMGTILYIDTDLA